MYVLPEFPDVNSILCQARSRAEVCAWVPLGRLLAVTVMAVASPESVTMHCNHGAGASAEQAVVARALDDFDPDTRSESILYTPWKPPCGRGRPECRESARRFCPRGRGRAEEPRVGIRLGDLACTLLLSPSQLADDCPSQWRADAVTASGVLELLAPELWAKMQTGQRLLVTRGLGVLVSLKRFDGRVRPRPCTGF